MPCNNLEHYTCLALKSLLIATSNFLTRRDDILDDTVPLPKYRQWDRVT